MNMKPVLALTLLSTLATAAADLPTAHADVASDRVLLVTGSSYGCTGTSTLGFRRLRQDPDGGSVQESIEYQVPAGHYLDISSIEYTVPYWLKWALGYSQSIDLNIRRRSGTGSAHVFSAKYGNGDTWISDGGVYEASNEHPSPGVYTNVASFPDGPLMGSGGRLCASASSNFWLYGGNVRVRGRLIPTGSPVVIAEPPTNSL
jgi:hypothetical protein